MELIAQEKSTRLQEFLALHKTHIETWLHKLLSWQLADTELSEALKYCVLNNGKRTRPALVYATAEALGIPKAHLDAAAASVELIHCYSLVHDDLPAMDDDDLRRGMPTCHKAFSEATAILVGDALQALAFEVLTCNSLNPIDPKLQAAMVHTLAKASGACGMVLGQMQDIAALNQDLEVDALTQMHDHKTGALFQACVQLALIVSPKAQDPILQAQLQTYAYNCGLIFQLQDDILDVIGETKTIGKPQGSDLQLGKTTFVSLLGIDEAKVLLQQKLQKALASLNNLGANADMLRHLAIFMANRTS